MRSWWHHEQVSIAAAVAAALYHSAQRGSDARPETHFAPQGQTTATEVEAHLQYYAPRGQEQPPPGVRPAPLPEVAGPQAVVTVGYVAAGTPSFTVVLQFLLQQSLLARAEEEEKAREEAVVKELEEDLALRERRLLQLVGELRGAGSEAHGEASLPSAGAWPKLRSRRGRRRG